VSNKTRIYVPFTLKHEARLCVNFGHDMGQMTNIRKIRSALISTEKTESAVVEAKTCYGPHSAPPQRHAEHVKA
jgi:hypothetical protein